MVHAKYSIETKLLMKGTALHSQRFDAECAYYCHGPCLLSIELSTVIISYPHRGHFCSLRRKFFAPCVGCTSESAHGGKSTCSCLCLTTMTCYVHKTVPPLTPFDAFLRTKQLWPSGSFACCEMRLQRLPKVAASAPKAWLSHVHAPKTSNYTMLLPYRPSSGTEFQNALDSLATI